MQRDNAYLIDILEAAKLVLEYIGAKNKEDFLKDTQCQDAVVRRFAVIGECRNRGRTSKYQSAKDSIVFLFPYI